MMSSPVASLVFVLPGVGDQQVTTMMDHLLSSGWGNNWGGGHGDVSCLVPAGFFAICFSRVEKFQGNLFHSILL